MSVLCNVTAISQVQHWLEALHDRRRALDGAWARRKAELEQALALAMLAIELASLDATLKVRHEALARSDQLGDSASSAELLLHEHNKLIPEAKVWVSKI
jgi:titin